MISGDDIYVLLDGDKKITEKFTDPSTISVAQYGNLSGIIRGEVGFDPLYHIPGGSDEAGHLQAKIAAQLEFLGWIGQRVEFFPYNVPEQLILEDEEPDKSHGKSTSKAAKQALKDILCDGLDVELNSAEILTLAKVRIAKISLENVDLVRIAEIIRRWLHENAT